MSRRERCWWAGVIMNLISIASAEPLRLTDDLTVRPLADGVWLHTTFRDLGGEQPLPSHGLLVETADGAVLVDTAWGETPTRALLDWAEQQAVPVRTAIVTHFHPDRLGGLEVAHERGVVSYGFAATRERVVGPLRPHRELLGTVRLEIGGVSFETFHPGPGHTVDNIVVWLPASGVLFGGCLVKGASARGLGYVADADVERWPESIRAVRDRYPQAKTIIPSHDAPGGTELLEHTLGLLAR